MKAFIYLMDICGEVEDYTWLRFDGKNREEADKLLKEHLEEGEGFDKEKVNYYLSEEEGGLTEVIEVELTTKKEEIKMNKLYLLEVDDEGVIHEIANSHDEMSKKIYKKFRGNRWCDCVVVTQEEAKEIYNIDISKLLNKMYLVYYTSEQISKEFDNLPKQERINILHDALDYMQHHNGRSKLLCIALAMGYDNDQGDSVSFYKKKEK